MGTQKLGKTNRVKLRGKWVGNIKKNRCSFVGGGWGLGRNKQIGKWGSDIRISSIVPLVINPQLFNSFFVRIKMLFTHTQTYVIFRLNLHYIEGFFKLTKMTWNVHIYIQAGQNLEGQLDQTKKGRKKEYWKYLNLQKIKI